MSNLVIVESPAKGRTIEKYLGKDYRVLASFGHVRDLPKSKLGVDVDGDFTPEYVIPPKSRKTISMLKNEAARSENVYLATDYDREGEAIAWHIAQAVGLGSTKRQILNSKNQRKGNIYRITFHEITKSAIEQAVKNPREIDMNLVDAQQARRVLDRLVGYKLSPFLWKKVAKGLSAGRVQSVAVRLVVEKEREIQAFKPVEYYIIEATFDCGKNNKVVAQVAEFNGDKIKANSLDKKTAEAIFTQLTKGDTGRIKSITSEESKRNQPAPFQTSTLQQEASNRLGFSAKQTMRLAQNLYESGKITYMRTDSINLAAEAVAKARQYISDNFGQEYLPATSPTYKSKTVKAQEAHEAIRPTDPTKPSDKINFETDQHHKLYDLIWRRLLASQMVPAKVLSQSIEIEVSKKDKIIFVARGQKIVFPGFIKVYLSKFEENILPELKEGEKLTLEEFTNLQKFTQPPRRYSEASLIKTLEENGIGRPSTYAPTLATIQDRNYVQLESRAFHPQEIGFVVTDILVEHFPEVVDISFTAKMEEELDEIAESKRKWQQVIKDFYNPFAKHLAEKMESVEKSEAVVKETDKKCPKCSKPMLIRLSRFGKFYACSGFPECRHTENFVDKTDVPCPECGKGTLVALRSKRGKPFFGCSTYPKCKFMTWKLPETREKDTK